MPSPLKTFSFMYPLAKAMTEPMPRGFEEIRGLSLPAGVTVHKGVFGGFPTWIATSDSITVVAMSLTMPTSPSELQRRKLASMVHRMLRGKFGSVYDGITCWFLRRDPQGNLDDERIGVTQSILGPLVRGEQPRS